MTHTKMLKILKSLSEKFGADYEVMHLMDYWGNEEMREAITIGHIIGWFEIKADNDIYRWYSITDRFRKLQEHIESGAKPIEVKTFYQDSYDKYMSDWKEKHPNEDYAEHYKKYKAKKYSEWLRTVNSLLGIYRDHLEVLNKIYKF